MIFDVFHSRSKVRNFIDFLDFFLMIQSRFPFARYFHSREDMFAILQSHGLVRRVLEFGVSKGYLSNFVLGKLRVNILSWHGFDTFEGLSDGWRDLPKGAYTNGGEVPASKFQQVVFVKGRVEETLKNFQLQRKDSDKVLVLFDLDLYEPSLFSYLAIRSSLLPGDLLYFDQAFDHGERKIILDYLLNDFEVELLGYTYFSCIFKITQSLK
jgi:hypothetical protein